MLTFLALLAVVAAAVALLAILMLHVARRKAAEMAALDASFRPIEEQTGACQACEGVGTRLQPVRSLVPVEMVTCYRCGGDGLPAPADRVDPVEGTWPLDSRIEQFRQAVSLTLATRKKRRR